MRCHTDATGQWVIYGRPFRLSSLPVCNTLATPCPRAACRQTNGTAGLYPLCFAHHVSTLTRYFDMLCTSRVYTYSLLRYVFTARRALSIVLKTTQRQLSNPFMTCRISDGPTRLPTGATQATYLCSRASRSAVGPTQTPTQWFLYRRLWRRCETLTT